MKTSTKLFLSALLIVGSTNLSAQIISEHFNAAPWVATAASTTPSTVTTAAGTWNIFNTQIAPTQQGSIAPSTDGALIFPKKNVNPPQNVAYVVLPTITTGGVGLVEIWARYGGTASVYSQLQLQKYSGDTWVTVGQTSMDATTGSKDTKYTIAVNDFGDNVSLRLYYDGDPTSAGVRVYDMFVYGPAITAPANVASSNITSNSFTVSWDNVLLADSYEIAVAKRTVHEGVELVANGGAEDADLSKWTMTTTTVSSTKPFEGANSFFCEPTASYGGILQKVAVEPGTKITVKAKTFITENTTGTGDPIVYTAETRLWGQFLDASNINVGNVRITALPELKAPSTDWVSMLLENIVVPATATTLDADFRTQLGVKAYFDNISVIGTTIDRVAISGSPFSTATLSLNIPGLDPEQDYSVYVYSVKGTDKKKSAELVVKTDVATNVETAQSAKTTIITGKGELQISNLSKGEIVTIMNLQGQIILQTESVGELFTTQLPQGAYLVKTTQVTQKIIL